MKTFTVWPRGARPPTLKSLLIFRSSSLGRLVPSIYNHYFFLPLTSRTVFLLDIRTQLQTPAAPTYASSDGGSGASSDGGSGAMPASFNFRSKRARL